MACDVQLRDPIDADLPVLFEYQRDPETCRMAAFPSRDWEAYLAHTTKISRDETVVRKVIVADAQVAGDIGRFEMAGLQAVGYVLGRNYWGKGIATRALAQLLAGVATRPLHAFVAKSNVGSIRVLEKNGFTRIREETSYAHGMVVEELLMRLGPTEP